MKKHYNFFRTLAALLIAGITFVSCTKDEEPGNDSKTYSVTINATKGGDNSSKQLDLDGNSISATWAVDEEVAVYKGSTPLGTLRATTAGTTTTLSGTLSGEIAVSDELTLKFCSPDYESQGGTLEYIAANCDYAEATVTVNDISGSTITTTDAAFVNKQAIVKFTLQDYSDNTIEASQLVVEVGGSTYTATISGSYTSTIYIALPGFSGQTVSLHATAGAVHYEYEKSGVSFSNSEYYTITVKMRKIVNLAITNSDYTAQDGDIMTGIYEKSGTLHRLHVADGATITLRDVNITGKYFSVDYNYGHGIVCDGDATIILEGTNTVEGSEHENAGIEITEGHTLIIQGTGTLNVSSEDGPGIGGGAYTAYDGGNIIINGGTINASGGVAPTSSGAAGIGGSAWAGFGNITINGGTITATGGDNGAGIGCGWGDNEDPSSCGNITITGGTIIATGGEGAAAIGCGYEEDLGGEEPYASVCGAITISGATGTVTAGAGATVTIGANTSLGSCAGVTINGTPYPGGYTESSF